MGSGAHAGLVAEVPLHPGTLREEGHQLPGADQGGLHLAVVPSSASFIRFEIVSASTVFFRPSPPGSEPQEVGDGGQAQQKSWVATTRSGARSLLGLSSLYLRRQRRECTGFTGAAYSDLVGSLFTLSM